MKKKAGKVFLIGAGPGDAGLFTLKGKECLSASDVVIYDGLVNRDILGWASPSARKIGVGKSESSIKYNRFEAREQFSQGQINSLMLRFARQGKKVARLKGGDPFLFGRGGEEAEFLASHRIPFEVVPGVSSLTAVPAYAGIPITDRRYNSMLTVVTGHSGQNRSLKSAVDWEKVSPDNTLVILMGVGKLHQIVKQLIKEGWRKTVPVACIQWGTIPQQRVIAGTLIDILKKVGQARPKILPPAVLVIGEVVKLRNKIGWFKPQGRSVRS